MFHFVLPRNFKNIFKVPWFYARLTDMRVMLRIFDFHTSNSISKECEILKINRNIKYTKVILPIYTKTQSAPGTQDIMAALAMHDRCSATSI